MDPSLIGLVLFGIMSVVAFMLYSQLGSLRTQLKEAKGVSPKKAIAGSSSKNNDAEKKLKAVKKELSSAKEALARKSKQLEEARTLAQKKAKKEAKKNANKEAVEMAKVEAVGSEDAKNKKHTQEVMKLKQALRTLEGEVSRAQKEAANAVKDAESEALELLRKKLDSQKEALHIATAAKAKVQKTLEELRDSMKKKAEARPEIEGSGLDLKTLDTEVVQELAKFYRKGEHFEKLFHVNQGQLLLAKEKNQELQKRYYAVCRELAVAATDKKDVSEEDAVRLAEAVSERTDRSIKPTAGNAKNNNAKNGKSHKDAGEGKKRRRRAVKNDKKTDVKTDVSLKADSKESEANGLETASDEAKVASENALKSEKTDSVAKKVPAEAIAEVSPKTEAAEAPVES